MPPPGIKPLELPKLDERVSETEDDTSVCYRINLPEYRPEDIRIKTVHEASTPIDEFNFRTHSTTGVTIVAENDTLNTAGDTATQTLSFELRLPPQAKTATGIRAFWRSDKHQVVIIIQKEESRPASEYRGLMSKYATERITSPSMGGAIFNEEEEEQEHDKTPNEINPKNTIADGSQVSMETGHNKPWCNDKMRSNSLNISAAETSITKGTSSETSKSTGISPTIISNKSSNPPSSVSTNTNIENQKAPSNQTGNNDKNDHDFSTATFPATSSSSSPSTYPKSSKSPTNTSSNQIIPLPPKSSYQSTKTAKTDQYRHALDQRRKPPSYINSTNKQHSTSEENGHYYQSSTTTMPPSSPYRNNTARLAYSKSDYNSSQPTSTPYYHYYGQYYNNGGISGGIGVGSGKGSYQSRSFAALPTTTPSLAYRYTTRRDGPTETGMPLHALDRLQQRRRRAQSQHDHHDYNDRRNTMTTDRDYHDRTSSKLPGSYYFGSGSATGSFDPLPR